MGYTDLEEKLNDIVYEVNNLTEKTEKERQLAIDEVEFIDRAMIQIVNDVNKMKVQITQIKNSDVNNGTEFYRLKSELKQDIVGQREDVEKEFDMAYEDMRETRKVTAELIHKVNDDQPMIDGMFQDIQEILKWKKDLEKEKLEEEIDSYIKTETIVEEDDEEDIEMETENEIEDTIDSQDEMEIIPRKTITTQNENLRFEWYKFSARFVTEEYKFKYVHPNAEVTNREKVFEWYEKCDNMGLVPDEFKL